MNGEDDDAALFEATVSGEPSAPSVAETTTEPTTEQQPSATRDAAGKFASKPSTPEITSAAPATPAEAETGTVPQQALHEARKRQQAAEERADRLEKALLERTQPPKPAAEPEKPVELWDDPDKWADNRLAARLTPLEQSVAEQKLGFSRMFANDKFGEDAVKAANDALGELAQTNRAEAERIAQKMHQSAHPYGELVSWHKTQQATQRIGNDPDVFVQTEIDRIASDPAAKAALIARLNGTAQVPASTAPVNRTVIPPSLNRIGSPANGAPAGGVPSDAELFESITGGR